MDDKEIMANIDQLIETEHRLRQQLASGELSHGPILSLRSRETASLGDSSQPPSG